MEKERQGIDFTQCCHIFYTNKSKIKFQRFGVMILKSSTFKKQKLISRIQFVNRCFCQNCNGCLALILLLQIFISPNFDVLGSNALARKHV